ncbi:MAG: chemotaxis protein CheX [Fibrobacteres bacterium]|nr:chemotaxis protein CheX [Fibrobacterota bacterium]
MPISIRAEHVNPFILSNLETFVKMVGIEAKPGKPILKQDARLDYDISGIIGLSGKVIGTVSLSFPEATALAVCNKFMSANLKVMNAEILDAVGELINIVAGNAKKGLTEFNIEISLPSVIVGKNHRIVEPKGSVGFVIPFASALGSFHMAVSLKPA